MTEDLFYLFFLLWSLTGGFNPSYVKALTASSYMLLNCFYK